MQRTIRERTVSWQLLAHAVLTFVLIQGYHIFRSMAFRNQMEVTGFIVLPLLYSALLIWLLRQHRIWLNKQGFESVKFRKIPLKTWLIGIFGSLMITFLLSKLWVSLNQTTYSLQVVSDYDQYTQYFGVLKGVLALGVYYFKYAMRIWMTFYMGYLVSLLLRNRPKWQAYLLMLTTWLVTYGFSEILYLGYDQTLQILTPLAIVASLTRLKAKYIPIAWFFMMMSLLI